jgi:hypothetical protein
MTGLVGCHYKERYKSQSARALYDVSESKLTRRTLTSSNGSLGPSRIFVSRPLGLSQM